MARNVLGTELMPCSIDPTTGFYRDAMCNTGEDDPGMHVVCVEMTEEFLEFSRSVGNDLSTPVPAYRFPGLRPGDRWCVVAVRWVQALRAGVAPPVILASTHEAALTVCRLEDLEAHALGGLDG